MAIHKMKAKIGLKVSEQTLISLSFILYFSMPFVTRCLRLFLSGFSIYGAIALTYLPLLLLLAAHRGKLRQIDFFILWAGILLLFVITYLIHPDYEYWYFREYYGVWDYVLRPDNGLYAYLFIRLVDDPKKILRYLQISACLMYIHLGYDYLVFLRRGYWEVVWGGSNIRASYNLEFGYDLLLYVVIFLYSALKYKKPFYWVMAAIGLLMTISGGSRGPILDIAIFLGIYFLVELVHSRRKTAILILLGILILILYYGSIPILNGLNTLLSKMGVSSRLLRMIELGTISDNNGREEIWRRAIQMIQDNPFGYGAMGSRHVISSLIEVGHPHNIFLEILIDYGVFIGSGLILALFLTVFRTLRRKELKEWHGLVMIFLGKACQLLLSGTYWHRDAIWGLLAVCVNAYYFRKEGTHRQWKAEQAM